MPADTTIPQAPSRHHGDASAPYPCSAAATPPRAAWSIDYGYCRTSLDWHGAGIPQGHGDPRCPNTCPHKAPVKVAVEFDQRFARDGAVGAAGWAQEVRTAGAAVKEGA